MLVRAGMMASGDPVGRGVSSPVTFSCKQFPSMHLYSTALIVLSRHHPSSAARSPLVHMPPKGHGLHCGLVALAPNSSS